MRSRAVLISLVLLASPAAVAPAVAGSAAQAIAQKFAVDDTPAKPERPSVDYEMEMLSQARTEEAERLDALKALSVAPAVLTPVATVAVPVAQEPAIPPAAAPIKAQTLISQAPAEPASEAAPSTTPSAAPTAAALETAPSPAPAAAAPETPPAPPAGNTSALEPPPATARLEDAPITDASPPMPGPRATLLLVIDDDVLDHLPGGKPDPIVCIDQQCWISNGLEAPARPMTRSQAVALKTSETQFGDSCTGKSGCVFRNIALGSDAQIEVIELGQKDGAREAAPRTDGPFSISPDTSCRAEDGDLVCDNGLATHAFRLWTVPEATAKTVGNSLLEDAVADGLPDDDGTDVSSGGDK